LKITDIIELAIASLIAIKNTINRTKQ